MPRTCRTACALLAAAAFTGPAAAVAHGPIFSFSPHTEFKGGHAWEFAYTRDQVAGEAENEYEFGYHYGVTSDLTLKAGLPYERGPHGSAVGDVHLQGKYRFGRWTEGPSLTSWTVLGGGRPDTSDRDESAGSAFVALAYGHEGVRWYRWASVGARAHAENDDGIEPGDEFRFNLAGGWRPRKPVYGEADTVFLVELNIERQERATANGQRLADTGGTEVFLSPAMFWTYGRHFSLRPGFQVPLASDLNGDQEETDFRARIAIEMHF